MEPERKKKHSWRSLRTDLVPSAVVCERECTQTAVSVRPFVAGDSRSEKEGNVRGGISLGRAGEREERDTSVSRDWRRGTNFAIGGRDLQ